MAGNTTPGVHPVKNIAIGVVTTVIASAAVYFLGFHQDSAKDELNTHKQATVNAWKSISDYIRYANEKYGTIACFSCDQQEMKRELIRELEQNCNSLRNLKEDNLIDEKMKSIIDRTLDRFNDLKPLYTMYFDSLTALKSYSLEDQQTLSQKLQHTVFDRKNYIETRDTAEISSFLNDINKKYKTTLNRYQTEATAAFEPAALIGKWKLECVIELEFKEDGSLIWTESGNEFKGKWKREAADLTINLDNGQNFSYQIYAISRKIMLLSTTDTGVVLGACPE